MVLRRPQTPRDRRDPTPPADRLTPTVVPPGSPRAPVSPPATRPTVPLPPAAGMVPETPQVFTPTPSPLRTGTNEAAEMYNAMLETFSTGLISGIETQEFDGRLLYREEPLGYRGAVTQVTVTTPRVDPFTGRQITETWFQIDPSLKPKDPFERRLEQVAAVSRAVPGLGTRGMQELSSMYGPSSPFIGPNDPVYSEDGADRLLRNIASNVNDLAILKSQLIKTGFLSPQDAGPLDIVYLDSKIFQAFRNAVDVAQSNDMKPGAFLEFMVNTGGTVSPAQPARISPAIRLTSAEDLKQVANSVAQRQIGRRLEDEELDRFAQAYQQTEAQFQRRLMGGGTVTAPPSIDVAAQEMVQQERPEEADLYSLGSTLDTFTQMLGGM
jgi:hypothetical protein